MRDHPLGPHINIPALVFCTSWCADFGSRGGACLQARIEKVVAASPFKDKCAAPARTLLKTHMPPAPRCAAAPPSLCPLPPLLALLSAAPFNPARPIARLARTINSLRCSKCVADDMTDVFVLTLAGHSDSCMGAT